MTAPNNPNDNRASEGQARAKTALLVEEQIFMLETYLEEVKENRSFTWLKHNIKTLLETYADSVAEERVKEARSKWFLESTSPDKRYAEGFRSGQERMRERAAEKAQTFKWADDNDSEVVELVAHRIRSLEVEEK